VRAAVYARFSTDKQRDASIDDQLRNCRRWAERHGAEVCGVFEDRGISGSSKDRPGFKAALAAANAGGFDVLLVDDLSRLSRDDVETKQTIRRFKFRGMRIVGVSDGYDSAQKGEKIQSTMRGLMNEMYLDDLREKTHRGLQGQALAGNNTGGKAYGYRHVPTFHPSKLDPHGRPVVEAVRREIDPEQASIVLEIFERYAAGWSPRRIATDLNGRGIPSPRGRKWQQTAIYGDPDEGTGILCNRLYIGVYQWNRREWRKDPDTGRRTKRVRDRSEWVETPMPELRIVPQELWDKAMGRRTALTAEKGERIRLGIRDANDKGRSTGRGPKYLFSGLLKCGLCGANYKVYSSTSYGCGLNIDGGHTACSNRFRLPRKVAETRLLDVLKGELFNEEACALFVQETSRLLREHAAGTAPDLKRAERDVEVANKEIENIMAAIRAGIITTSTKTALEAAEARKSQAEGVLSSATAADSKAANKVVAMLPRALDRYRTMLGDLAGVLGRDVDRARAQLRQLLGDIRLHPAGRGLEAEISADWFGALSLAGTDPARLKVLMVAGAGFEPTTLGL
jgi:site-specific DNA recombinase